MNVGQCEFVTKSAATSRTAVAISAADPHLTIALTDAGVYLIEAFLRFTAPATPGFSFAPLCTSVPVLSLFDALINNNEQEGSSSWRDVGGRGAVWQNTSLVAADQITGGNGSNVSGEVQHVLLRGVMEISGACTFSIGWAQRTSSATATTLEQDSFLLAQRLA
jgi:hypothetical protein